MVRVGVSLGLAGLLILLRLCVYVRLPGGAGEEFGGCGWRGHIHYQGKWLPLDSLGCCLLEELPWGSWSHGFVVTSRKLGPMWSPEVREVSTIF